MADVIAVTGGTGFIGGRLIDMLAERQDVTIRALCRRKETAGTRHNVVSIRGNVRDTVAFSTLLEQGCTWINLAHLDLPSEREHIEIWASLAEICRRRRIKRLVHCSTATVVGRSNANVVTEATECRPWNRYEATKRAIEQLLLDRGGDAVQTVVLRPTAVFGRGGRNLVKLAGDLAQRASINYLRSCLQGRRRMNLVHVDNVAAALTMLVHAGDAVAGEIFIVSDDEYPSNNYRDVESLMIRAMGLEDYPIPLFTMPRSILSAALRAAGRSNINPDRIYDCAKLRMLGLTKPVAFEQGLSDFVAWYLQGRHAGCAK